MERHPLVDELLVMDSDSTDRTREIAAAEGARVAVHQQVLPRYGSYRGKGEALWKSLYETSGDIVVWADTDVRNWHPRMVYGTVGPLIAEERIQYVKGYYRRPIVEGGVLKEGGGGRVTELVARPLINLFYPELSGLIQPLAGEYAGRRSLLETIPFFTGYAVEIGHLIDVADRVGLEGLGQVDLERRIHRNQELEGLSRMSFVILQAVMKRLEERRRTRLFAELGSTMKLPRSGHGKLGLEVIELADHERPPMIRIPEYLEKRRVDRARAPRGGRRRAGCPRAGHRTPPGAPRRRRGARRRLGGRVVTERRRDRLRVLLAPDSFKGSLSSVEVARALADGWARARPDDELVLAPLADGGEGTLAAIAETGGWEWQECPAHDPLGRPLTARWLLSADGHAGRRGAGRGVGAVAAAGGRAAQPARGHRPTAPARSCRRSSTRASATS